LKNINVVSILQKFDIDPPLTLSLKCPRYLHHLGVLTLLICRAADIND